MALFSQRKGIRPLQKAIQHESIDDELRNSLWSALKATVWDNWAPTDYMGMSPERAQRVERLVQLIWVRHFKLPLDSIPSFDWTLSKSSYSEIRNYFFSAKWWEVYDFIEFILGCEVIEPYTDNLTLLLNDFLEAENAAYRIIDDKIVEITDNNEIKSVEDALSQGISATKIHFKRALELLSDKKQPDYRNSIKESISAVEATCQSLSGNEKATLSDCLKILKNKKPIHAAFEEALKKLYGYTSDDGGIRHSLAESSIQPTYADAKFMLVSCSAFTNYLLTKASETQLKRSK